MTKRRIFQGSSRFRRRGSVDVCRRLCLILATISILISIAAASAAEVDYSESVAMTGHAEDLSITFDVRLARFPGRSSGALWFFVFVDGHSYALVDESVALTSAAATQVSAADAVFEVRGQSTARLAGRDRYTSAMTGRLSARGHLHELTDPDPGAGEIPAEIEADFIASHEPIRVREGRIEVMGRVRGRIRINGIERVIDLPGKWHEQTGVRPQFAPAFTYLFVQGDRRGIMATKHASGAWGYVLEDDTVTGITALQITPYGSVQRDFLATLADGREITGSALVVREVSVPIEGQRRPGASVVVESSLGRLVGVLNDWAPSP